MVSAMTMGGMLTGLLLDGLVVRRFGPRMETDAYFVALTIPQFFSTVVLTVFQLVLVPEFTMMPVTSAIEPLRLANRLAEKSLYKWTMHSVDGKPVAASNGILTMVDGDLTAIPDHSTIIVCGGLIQLTIFVSRPL